MVRTCTHLQIPPAFLATWFTHNHLKSEASTMELVATGRFNLALKNHGFIKTPRVLLDSLHHHPLVLKPADHLPLLDGKSMDQISLSSVWFPTMSPRFRYPTSVSCAKRQEWRRADNTTRWAPRTSQREMIWTVRAMFDIVGIPTRAWQSTTIHQIHHWRMLCI